MKLTSTFLSLKIIGAAVTGVYFFEHPRAWAAEMPTAPESIVEMADVEIGIDE